MPEGKPKFRILTLLLWMAWIGLLLAYLTGAQISFGYYPTPNEFPQFHFDLRWEGQPYGV